MASPWLLLGFLLAGFLKVFVPSDFLYRHFTGGGFRSILMATLIGIPLPLCSCGVIPVGVGLYRQGVPKPATLAFFISTPATTVSAVILSIGMLGWKFALLEIIICFSVAFLTGSLFFLLEERGRKRGKVKGFSLACVSTEFKREAGLKAKITEMFRYGFVEMVDDVGLYVLIGLFTAGIVAVFLPSSLVAQHLGGGILPLLVMVFIGTPMYICSTASIPFVAAMAGKGMSLSAGLVFLVAGPATNLSTILVIGKAMDKGTAALYLSSIIVFSVLLAYGFQTVGWI
jgi:hypothetical protein